LGDEPTGEVDTETSQKLIALMRRLNRETGVTFILVTHDLDLASRTDRLVRLKDGRVISDERQTARVDPAEDIADLTPTAGAADGKGEVVAVG
jgi:putative ABC transport system ATP-binding protein